MKLPSNVVVSGVILVTLLGGFVFVFTAGLYATISTLVNQPHAAAEQAAESDIAGVVAAIAMPVVTPLASPYPVVLNELAAPTTAAIKVSLERKFEQVLPYSHRNDTHSSPLATREANTIVVPLIWHIPKSGGTFLKGFVSCLNVTVASESGKYNFSASPPTINLQKSLEVLSRPSEGQCYVNVDVSSPEGIREAHDLGFMDRFIRQQDIEVQNNLVIVTSFVHSAAQWLFPENDGDGDEIKNDRAETSPQSHKIIKGLLLTVFRHPMDRAASLFHYLKYAKHETTYHPEWQNLSSIAEWENGEDNWMVRFLSGVGEMGGRNANRPLADDDLQRAKGILSNFTLIGLTDRMDETLDRFGVYMGWDRRFQDGDRWHYCRQKFSNRKHNAAINHYDPIQPNTPEWEHLLKRNRLDLELYQHAMDLFQYQGKILFAV